MVVYHEDHDQWDVTVIVDHKDCGHCDVAHLKRKVA